VKNGHSVQWGDHLKQQQHKKNPQQVPLQNRIVTLDIKDDI